jgi:RNA polymerase sigma-70 factor (ECF subfamily)
MRGKELPNDVSALDDQEIIEEILNTNGALFEVLMRRYNTRIYRVARSVVRDDAEAEDVAQHAWVQAYLNLAQFAGAASFSTWLSKIAVHEALSRVRHRSRVARLPTEMATGDSRSMTADNCRADPERAVLRNEIHNIVELALDALPAKYRSVFVLRCIEQLSVAETAAILGTSEQVVRARLHRARSTLKRSVREALGLPPNLYGFPATRCDRLVHRVKCRLATLQECSDPITVAVPEFSH